MTKQEAIKKIQAYPEEELFLDIWDMKDIDIIAGMATGKPLTKNERASVIEQLNKENRMTNFIVKNAIFIARSNKINWSKSA